MPYAVVSLIIGAAMAFAWSQIFRRIGWPPWMAVVAIVLPVNIVILFVVAFSRWPVESQGTRQAP
ncbi:MAG TPA: hypothetical protein VI855_06785 [Dehalococcoidia bacterium]|nr:hypothetical protein [Dehalococcoidia bacterium]